MKILFQKRLFNCSVILLFLLLAAGSCLGQIAPVIGLHENTPNVVAFKNVRIIIAPGRTIQNGTMVIRDDRIESVGTFVVIPPDAVIRDVNGKTIYPGFIDLFTNYGIPQIAQREVTTGTAGEEIKGGLHWNAAVRPEQRASKLFRPDERTAQSFRKNGITMVLAFPPDGIFRGIGALTFLTDTSPNRAIFSDDVAQAMSFSKGRSITGRGIAGYPGSLMGGIALIRQTFLDALWYDQAWTAFRKAPAGQTAPEINLSLADLYPYAVGRKPVVMEVSDELDILRADKISKEFGLEMWVMCSGYEYRRLQAVKNTGIKLIVPLNFPEAPDVSTAESELDISFRDLRHWDFAPENPSRLAQANIDFALTTSRLQKIDDFLSKLRTAVKRGLSPDRALASLTTVPSEWLKMSQFLGTLEAGKIANFIISDGDLFADKTKILETWVAGKRYEITPQPEVDVRGTWTLQIVTKGKVISGSIVLLGEPAKLQANLSINKKKINVPKVILDRRLLSFVFPGDSIGFAGMARMSGIVEERSISGSGPLGDGSILTWQAELKEPWKEKPEPKKLESIQMTEFPIVYPEGAFGRTEPPVQPEVLLIRNATIWTCGPYGILENVDLLVKKGKIAVVGKNISIPEGAVVINAEGKHITPGLIDAHSHIAISGGVNEGTHAISSETRISDVINSDDINIYRQLAGGLTSSYLLHGSANPIGGQTSPIKLRWGALPEEMKFDGAKLGIKFALGENVKQSSRVGQFTPRYPRTRMGVEQLIRDTFLTAKDYRREWEEYNTKLMENKNLIPPRKDLRLEPLLDVLDGKIQVHCHSYRQDETLSTIRLAEEIGFKVDVLIHILEGYKVAEVLKKHGSMPTTFTDWWAYKYEVWDAIPYNGALMYDQGLLVSFNSDNSELARRMNLEAAKAVKYGNVSPEEALKFVTLNSAKQLCIDNRVGSLEVGKDADFVIWSGSPLSTYSICEQTWIDGQKYFDIEEDKELREKMARERAVLVQKILREK